MKSGIVSTVEMSEKQVKLNCGSYLPLGLLDKKNQSGLKIL